MERANTGDRDALRQLQLFLDEHPEIWQTVGDLSKNAEVAMLRLIAGENKLIWESLERTLRQLRRDLTPASCSALERLLVDRIVFCWLRLQYLETNYASLADLCLPEKKFALQQKESAQRLFDAAVKSLRTVSGKLNHFSAPTPDPCNSAPESFKLRIRRAV